LLIVKLEPLEAFFIALIQPPQEKLIRLKKRRKKREKRGGKKGKKRQKKGGKKGKKRREKKGRKICLENHPQIIQPSLIYAAIISKRHRYGKGKM